MAIPKLGYRQISHSSSKSSKRPIRQVHYKSGFNFSYNLPKSKLGLFLYRLRESVKNFFKR